MSDHNKERPAFLIIDMVKDNFDPQKNLPITPLARHPLRPLMRVAGSPALVKDLRGDAQSILPA